MKQAVLEEFDRVIRLLEQPLSDVEKESGWTEKSQKAVIEMLRTARANLEIGRYVPDLSYARGLDFWGITAGELLEDIAKLSNRVRELRDKGGMNWSVEYGDREREPLDDYDYKVYRDGRQVGTIWHDIRLDEWGIKLNGHNVQFSNIQLTQALEGGGPEPLQLTKIGKELFLKYDLSSVESTRPKDIEKLDAVGTGYSVSFEDFLLLLRNASSDDQVAHFLKLYLGLSIVAAGEEIKLLSLSGEETDTYAAYLEIELDSILKFRFYQLAMGILR